MSSKFRKRKRNRNNKLPARFTLLIMTGVCTKVFDYLEKKFSIYE